MGKHSMIRTIYPCASSCSVIIYTFKWRYVKLTQGAKWQALEGELLVRVQRLQGEMLVQQHTEVGIHVLSFGAA